jgi:hypothetical protein
VGNVELSKIISEHPLHNFKAREAVWLFVRDPHELDETEQRTLQAIRQASLTADSLYHLVQE